MNCLPLYEPPPVEEDNEQALETTDSTSSSSSPKKSSSNETSPNRKFTLIKARSAERLDSVAAELELHDHDYEDYKSDGESFSKTVRAVPRNWSRMSKSYSKNLTVMVRNVDELPSFGVSPAVTTPGGSGERNGSDGEGKVERLHTETGEEEGSDVAPVGGETGGGKDRSDSEEAETSPTVGEGTEGGGDVGELGSAENKQKSANLVKSKSTPTPDTSDVSIEVSSDFSEPQAEAKPKSKQASRLKKKKSLRGTKSASPIGEVENGSDGEGERELTVNYLDTNTMSTLRRSSGSVSFYYRSSVLQSPTSAAIAMEMSIEESMEEDEELGGDSDNATPQTATPQTVVVETKLVSEEENTAPTAPPLSAITTPPSPVISVLASSLLQATPPTLDQEYLERSGWLTKLSHRRGMFGDKWQKRYFVLHRSWLYYFKKYGVSEG